MLLTISDLNQPQENLNWYLERVNDLSQTYFDYVATSTDDTYEYTVRHFGGKDRAAGIHASEMSNCLRQLVYSLNGTERKADTGTADVNMLMRFNMGTAIHAMLQNDWHRIAEKSGGTIQFEDEVKVSPKLGGVAQYWGLHSSCDGIITLLYQGQPILRVGIEIKSQSDKSFQKNRSPESYHIEQTTLYMAALDLPLMWTIYYNKSNSNITTSYAPYVFQFNQKLWSETLQPRFATAHDMAARGVLPEGTEGMPCGWCAFSHTCKPKYLQPQSTKKTALAQGMTRRQR